MKWLLRVLVLVLGVLAEEAELRYAVLMDAGSTGTRVHVYKWEASRPMQSLSQVGSTKERIALSSLVDNDAGVESLLNKLIGYADTHIPEKKRASTTVSLKATAGLRRLGDNEQDFLIAAVHTHFDNSDYSFLPEDTSVIPGHEEALYDYMAVVVAMEEVAVGVLDLGGASKQLSYIVELDNTETVGSESEMMIEVVTDIDGESQKAVGATAGTCIPDYVLQLPGATGSTGLVARSIQGMGLLAAMDFILDMYVTAGDNGVTEVLPQPCLAVGETVKGEIHEYDVPLQGYGNVTECYELIRHHFLDKVAEEIDLNCLQKHKPSKFFALDNFPKLMEMIGLVGSGDEEDDLSKKLDTMKTITPQAVLEAGHEICQLGWDELLAKFPDSYPAYRAQRACFGAAYMYFFMTDVYGIGGHSQGEFFPLDSHDEHDLGWVLGAVAVSAHSDHVEPLISQSPNA